MGDLETSRAERLDQYVVRQRPALSRAFAAKLIERGEVTVNGRSEKPGYRLRPNDRVEILYDAAQAAAVPEIDLEVLYEDDDCVVINKPAGLLAHSKGAFNSEATVATWLKSRLQDLGGERGGIVHRLDRATSGLLIGAKNQLALQWLQKQFSQRKVKKTYAAVVQGTPNLEQAVIDMPIERNPRRPQTFRVGSNGKPAVTAYKVLASNGRCSLLELKPTTGRTHQLRVHLQHTGHPILGDTLYGGPEAERLFLHAESLDLTLPNRSRQIFTVPVPTEFKAMVEA